MVYKKKFKLKSHLGKYNRSKIGKKESNAFLKSNDLENEEYSFIEKFIKVN